MLPVDYHFENYILFQSVHKKTFYIMYVYEEKQFWIEYIRSVQKIKKKLLNTEVKQNNYTSAEYLGFFAICFKNKISKLLILDGPSCVLLPFLLVLYLGLCARNLYKINCKNLNAFVNKVLTPLYRFKNSGLINCINIYYNNP